jgi:hypothetical protein
MSETPLHNTIAPKITLPSLVDPPPEHPARQALTAQEGHEIAAQETRALGSYASVRPLHEHRLLAWPKAADDIASFVLSTN